MNRAPTPLGGMQRASWLVSLVLKRFMALTMPDNSTARAASALVLSSPRKLLLARVGRMQHVGFDRFMVKRPADAQLQPGKILSPRCSMMEATPTVSTGTTPQSQPDTSQGKIKVVMDDQHLLWQELEIPQQPAHSLTTAVHIGERFEEVYLCRLTEQVPHSA